MRILDVDDPARASNARVTTLALIAAWERAGHECAPLDAAELTLVPPGDTLVQYRLHASDHYRLDQTSLEAFLRSCPQLSDPAEAVLAARDKLIGQRLLSRAGLPVPPWLDVDELVDDDATEIVLGPAPWVVKPACGAMGTDIALVETIAAARVHRAAFGACVLQQRIRVALNARCLTSPVMALATYERCGEGGLVTSVSMGARRRDLPAGRLRSQVEELSARMCVAMNGHVLGCDVLVDTDEKLWALEANTNPGFDEEDAGLADRFIAAVAQCVNSPRAPESA